MKKNDSGDFTILFVEATDERASLFQTIAAQKKPVVIMITEQTRVFQRPDDFTALKHLKRQLDLPIIFVIPQGGHMAQLAARNGFPVYLSMDALADALNMGQLTRSRSLNKATTSLGSSVLNEKEKAATTTSLNAAATAYPRITAPIDQQQAMIINDTIQPTRPVGPKPSLFEATDLTTRQTTPLTKKSMSGTNLLTQEGTTHKRLTPISGIGEAPTAVNLEREQPLKTMPLEDDLTPRRTYHSSPLTTKRRTTPRPSSSTRVTPPVLAPELPRITQTNRPTAPKSTGSTGNQKNTRRPPIAVIVLVIALITGVLGALIVLPQSLLNTNSTAGTPSVAGQMTFSSSNTISETSSQGIEDQLTVTLSNIPTPAAHKQYYAWLLGDKSQTDLKALLLGTLPVTNGNTHLFYQGDGQHTNLLLTMSRFLVTEEDATVTPITPSPDQTTWRFYGEIPSTPIKSAENTKNFSFLDHLRHLLASDPTLEEIELPGGLNTWFYRNSAKVVEWTTSTRDRGEETKDVNFVRSQTMRALQYLDGNSFVYQDMPANSPLLVNERLARIGLISVNGPNQDPPSYTQHIAHHLNGLLQASDSTKTMRQKMADLVTALNNVDNWMQKVHTDAKKIMQMSDDQLRQPDTLNLLGDMIDNANNAYTGQIDPATKVMREGATWIHDHIQDLANLNITKFTGATNHVPNQTPQPDMHRAIVTPERKNEKTQKIIYIHE